MFAARADLRAHVTRTHRNLSTPSTPVNTTNTNTRRPQRRAASLQHRYISASPGADEDERAPQQDEDDFRCPICHRQFTSARLLDRHTYAVHEPKHESYDDRDYQGNEVEEEEDEVRDYADDELEEKPSGKIHVNPLKTDEMIAGDGDEEQDEPIDEEELDLAPIVEDIFDDEDASEQIPTIKSVSSAHRKQIAIVRKFDELEQDPNEAPSNKRQCVINRSKWILGSILTHAVRPSLDTYKTLEDTKGDFDVFGFDGWSNSRILFLSS